ncbi:MAG: hypothetical protein JST54_04730 [Deltaproteobacteria bacterium]|nr:hypothetical protein [Deltaproteobacteria bacterium]
MAIHVLRYGDSLDVIWEELVYTEARLLADSKASDLAALFSQFIQRMQALKSSQQTSWQAEIRAQASVDAADDQLDDVVRGFADNLLFALGNDRTQARFTRYFGDNPSAIIKLGLESELTKVRSWPASIGGEPEPQLQAFGAQLQAAITAGDAALASRTAAAGARADGRARGINTFIDDVNAARQSLYGTLTTRVGPNKLPRDWPERFFKHAVKPPKPPPAAGPQPAKT